MAQPVDDPNRVYFATCDARGARLLAAQAAWPARIRIEPLHELESGWDDFHERGRPMMLGRGPTPNASQFFADEHREPDEMAERFARDAVQWLEGHARALRCGQLAVFAADRTLGHLRGALRSGRTRLVLLEGNLSPLRSSELATHPQIEALVRTGLAGMRELPLPPVARAMRAGAGGHERGTS
jgi:hypothetical protein